MPPPRAPIQRLAGLGSNRGIGHKAGPKPGGKKACCDSPDIQDFDGSKICANCGTEISQQNIVAEVTFGETATGAATVQGGFVGESARHARTFGAAASRRLGGNLASREESENNGRRELRSLAPRLNVPPNVEEVAFTIWKLATNLNFVQGRRTDEVAACCLYAACRRERDNTVLLMDISEILRVNVFALGDIYKDLCKKLMVEVHDQQQAIVDIEPLILKYARKLEFGEKTRQVAEDAVKIMKRMKRDWMITGRHPAGLCGACIIVAARMNNFRRTVREVVYVVKVSDMTIAKRLEEFKRTRSSALTVDQFRMLANRIKHQHDPPSVYEAQFKEAKMLKKKQKREAHLQKVIEIQSNASSRASSIEPSTSPMPEQAAAAPPPQKKRRTSQTSAAPVAPSTQRRDADGFLIPALPIDPALLPTPPTTQQPPSRASASPSPSPSTSPVDQPKRGPGRPPKHPKPAGPAILTEADLAGEHELEDEIEEMLTNNTTLADAQNAAAAERVRANAVALADQQRALSASLAFASGRRVRAISDAVEIGEDEFDDDPEVANCLLSEAQVRVKERIWVLHNEDWLRAQQAKQLRLALEEAEGIGKNKVAKKRKRSRMGDGTVLTDGATPVESPAEAAQRMVEKRGTKMFSRSINYEALGRIYGRKDRGSQTPAESREGSEVPNVDVDGLPTPPPTQAVAAAEVEVEEGEGGEGQEGTQQKPAKPNGEGDGEGGEGEEGAENEGEEEAEGAEEEVEEEEEEEEAEEEDFEEAVDDTTGHFGLGSDDEAGYGDEGDDYWD